VAPCSSSRNPSARIRLNPRLKYNSPPGAGGVRISDLVAVRFLGSGDAFGSGGRLQTCIYVESELVRFLIDCGTSSLIGMKRWGVEPSSVDAILVTHLHGDHFGGIPFFILDAQFSKRTRPLALAGPPGLRRRVREAQEVLFPGSSSVQQSFTIDYTELQDGEPTGVGPLRVTAHRVIHASGAPPYAVRIDCGGRVISYSGDTEWTDALLRVAQGADLFVCEAYYFEKKIRFHLDYRTLMDHRDDLDCRRMILTHMSADMLRHRDRVDVECADDGARIVL
jgi:ribonuclease BN (tRNA processing enzyme)